MGPKAENLTVSNGEGVTSEDQRGVWMGSEVVACPAHPGLEVGSPLASSPVFADRVHRCQGGSFCHTDGPHPYLRPLTLCFRNKFNHLQFSVAFVGFLKNYFDFKKMKNIQRSTRDTTVNPYVSATHS